MDLKEKLNRGTGLSIAEDHFVKPPQLPYITFLEDKEIRGISTDNLIIFNGVTVELYTSLPDTELETKVRNVIIDDILKNSNNDDEFEVNQNREYIESEQMYMTVYDFTLIEKGGI